MYPAPFRYHRVGSLAEATRLLTELGEAARPLAGGQSLLALMKLRIDQPADLVDIGRIPGLSTIEEATGEIRIGALATHAAIARADIARRVPIVGDCARGIADNQVRSRGTIGGNVSAGDPSCDWPTLLTALDGRVHCEGPSGKRSVPVDAFIEGLYATVLRAGEMRTVRSRITVSSGSHQCSRWRDMVAAARIRSSSKLCTGSSTIGPACSGSLTKMYCRNVGTSPARRPERPRRCARLATDHGASPSTAGG